ncbi:MAG: gamma-glutamyltransferase [Acidimicrobiales bacterium]
MAAGHPAVVDAAAAMLRAGGNAYDAVVAAGFAGTVAEPGFTSLGGGGYVLARTAAGDEILFDFFVDTPGRGKARRGAAPLLRAGGGAVPGRDPGVPLRPRLGGRAGRAGRPAARAAPPGPALPARGRRPGRDPGWRRRPLAPKQATVLALLEPILRRTPDVEAIFAPDGRLAGAGDRLRNPDLARFLDRLGIDPGNGFYRGRVATQLARAMADGAGLVTAEDLASYRVIERDPLAFEYRGRRVLTNPPPSFGGRLIAIALDLLQEAGPLPRPGSADHAHALARAMIEVDRRRSEERDPSTTPTSVRGTTHVSVADVEGNVAAMTTSNGECSGDVIAGTGVLLNNMLGEEDLHPGGFHAGPPGVRVASMMAPTIVVAPGGDVELVLGSGGSKRIRTAVLQVLTLVVDGGVPVDAAVDAPRLHWDTDHLEVEPGLSAGVVDHLRTLGPVNTWPERNLFFGGVHAVAPGRGAAGDPRRDGASGRIPGPAAERDA